MVFQYRYVLSINDDDDDDDDDDENSHIS